MNKQVKLPLKELSIHELFISEEKCTYEIPIYQRNYAWEQDEICALIHDVEDSYSKKIPNHVYYIGTLVTYDKKDRVFEVIDGQQRLTTIYIVLKALGQDGIVNKLTYRARKKSDYSLNNLTNLNPDCEIDSAIENGYKIAKEELATLENKQAFQDYFLHNVHIIRYMVPSDIDLNHYFEIMNSRGEQLEKHEIVKANLMEKLDDDADLHVFHVIWDCCSQMNKYVQQKMESATSIFGNELYQFIPSSFADIKKLMYAAEGEDMPKEHKMPISKILSSTDQNWDDTSDDNDKKDTFQPIIDFPNFLLIVLKLFRLSEPGFRPEEFNLDDKELLNEFDNVEMDSEKVKRFAYILLKSRFLLDNFVVHHSTEEDTIDSNPWKLQIWHKDTETKKEMLRNLVGDRGQQSLQDRLVHLLSMFEVAFTAKQRKNYLLYCLMYLMQADINTFDCTAYASFLDNMAYRYFNGVYLTKGMLSKANKPIPGSFDQVMINNGCLNDRPVSNGTEEIFNYIFGDGTKITEGVPLFIFNYADYKIWQYYDATVRGKEYKKGSPEREAFFKTLGCSDFELKIFDQFYFSRTRKSLEHYFPQNQATGIDGRPSQEQINCFGNFAMIGSEANSSGSDWNPVTKLTHYLDSKTKQVSVASLKFWIMMQICKDHQHWNYEDICVHQNKMLALLL